MRHTLANKIDLMQRYIPIASAGIWLKSLSQRLLHLKEEAMGELRKHSTAALTPALFRVRGEGAGRLALEKQGGMHMQAAADQITRIADLLAEYRCANLQCRDA